MAHASGRCCSGTYLLRGALIDPRFQGGDRLAPIRWSERQPSFAQEGHRTPDEWAGFQPERLDHLAAGQRRSEVAEVFYKCTELYDADDEIGVRWDDPELGIEWPVAEPLLSPKDAALPTLAELKPRLESMAAGT